MHWLRSTAVLASSLVRNALRRKAQVELNKLSDFTLLRLGVQRNAIPTAADKYAGSVCPRQPKGERRRGPAARKGNKVT